MRIISLGLLALFAFAMTAESASRVVTIEVKGMA